MAVKDYNQYFSPNLSEYDGNFTYAVDWNDTWKFRNGMGRMTKNFYGFGKHFSDLDDLKTFIKTFLTTTSVGQNPGPSESDIDSMDEAEAYAVLGSAIYNSNVKKGTIQKGDVVRPNSKAESALRTAIKHYKEYKSAVTALEEKGATPAQIQSFLQSDKVQTLSSTDWSNLASNIPTMSGSELASYGMVKPEDTGGDPEGDPDTDPPGIPISESDSAVGSADTVAETVDEQITEAVVGDSSLDALKKEEGFREEDGRYFVGDQEYAYDEENDQVVFAGGENNGERWTPEGSGMANQYDTLTEQEQQTIAQQQGIVDEIVGTDEVDPVTGEKVTPGLVNEYGDFVDQTLTDIDADENDFAKQINAQLNQFLIGKDADGNDILDDKGNPIKGFLDYQSDLEDAAKTYKTDMQGLQGLYDDAYSNYEGQLSPLRKEIADVRQRLGDVSAGQMEVARDAADQNYYNRLQDVYFAEAAEGIQSDVDTAQDRLQTNFAASGADPNSPAYTAAIMDLQKSRGDAMRSARRQSLLDSYGLGSQMLSNRTTALSGAGNALGNEMAGVQTEMGALDSLYGVKLQGLNTRRDMIGQIYGADKDIAATGISGLNTVLGTNLKGIDANQNQFNTKINLSNDLYKNKAGMYGTAFDALGGMRGIYDKEGGDRFNTLTEFNLGQGSNKLTLETLRQYASENPNYTIDPDLEKFLSGGK